MTLVRSLGLGLLARARRFGEVWGARFQRTKPLYSRSQHTMRIEDMVETVNTHTTPQSRDRRLVTHLTPRPSSSSTSPCP